MNRMWNFAEVASRSALAVLFLLFGASKWVPFMPTPAMQPEAARFIGALVTTGYLWYLVGVIEVVGGLLLLWRRTTGWALILLSPIVVNIILYLLVLQQGIGAPPILMSLFLLVNMVFLGYTYRSRFSGVFV